MDYVRAPAAAGARLTARPVIIYPVKPSRKELTTLLTARCATDKETVPRRNCAQLKFESSGKIYGVVAAPTIDRSWAD